MPNNELVWLDWLLSIGLSVYAAFNARAKPDVAAKALGVYVGYHLLVLAMIWLATRSPYSPSRLAVSVTIGIWGWFAYKVWTGRTWALVMLTVLMVMFLLVGDGGNTLRMVVDLICTVATVGAVVTIVQNRMDESREALASAQDAAE